MSTKHRFAVQLKAARKRRGLTQERLAAAIGRSVDAISALERGKAFPSFEMLGQLALALDIPAAVLAGQDDEGLSVRRSQLLAALSLHVQSLDDDELSTAVELVGVLVTAKKR